MSDLPSKRPRQDGEEGVEPAVKRHRDASPASALPPGPLTSNHNVPPVISRLGLKPQLPVLPPSLELVTGKKTDLSQRQGFVGEKEVGIIGYVGNPSFQGVTGVIKQRFTDFLVNEISLDGEIIHLHDIGKPKEPVQSKPAEEAAPEPVPTPEDKEDTKQSEETEGDQQQVSDVELADLPADLSFESHPQWPTSTTVSLRKHFSDETVKSLHALFLDGKTPKPAQDSGWGQRDAKKAEMVDEEEIGINVADSASASAPRQGRDVGRGRGGRGQRGGRPAQWRPEDSRQVISQVIDNKDERGAAHKIIRELFSGTFETTARDTPGQGQRLVIKWSSVGGRQARQERKNRERGPKLPQFIHFTLHKTNRETQDCLSHVSRMLNVHTKDLSVCGTKDKRAVTVQRVSLRRGNMTLQAVWKAVNGLKTGRRTEETAVIERGERGTRIGDLTYAPKPLDLGMLKGNHFTITLRNVQASSDEDIDRAMESIRDRGFINFFGMQRFGTSTVPTHVTGLMLLQGKWGDAIDSILSLREGEHPDCVKARLAWLEDQNFAKALEIMPRRSVAERSIWEHWKKGNLIQDKVGALGAIPRNLRTIYVHAYQSYIWNLLASERIKLSNTSALVGDLVFADGNDNDDSETRVDSSSSREVKVLTEADVGNYTLADVVLPLPGWNVQYPEGELGEMYLRALAADGLDPSKMRRDQREYSLPGSYRKIIHKPTNVSWEHIRYTDPDLPLVQSDEDAILGLNSPADNDPEGKFRALKISWSCGTSSYATMALREITRQETSTWAQIGMTMTGEDQAHKGTGDAAKEEAAEE